VCPCHEQWRLITNLLNHTRHPAQELVDLHHERWQIETTTYYSIKATILDGRILRSHTQTGIDQEVYALLTSTKHSSTPQQTPPPPAQAWTWTASASPSS
jgi:hypothetical protein